MSRVVYYIKSNSIYYILRNIINFISFISYVLNINIKIKYFDNFIDVTIAIWEEQFAEVSKNLA